MHRKFDELRLAGSLPSPSSIGRRVLDLSKDEEGDGDALIRTILADPALSGRIVKVANAGDSGLPPVTSVAQARIRLGVPAIRRIALGFSLVADNRRGQAEYFDYGGYWTNALSTAVTVHMLAQVARHSDPSSAFTCALFSDVGKLALASTHPERYSDILRDNPRIPDLALARLESRAFGIDHFEVSAAILADWGLPREFQEVALLRAQESAGNEHDGADVEETSKVNLLTLVRSGRQITRILTGSWDVEDSRWRDGFLSLAHLCDDLRMEYAALLSLCDAVVPSWREWSKIIGVDSEHVGSFQDVAAEYERRGLRSAVLTAPTAARTPSVPPEAESNLFQAELDLPLHPLETVKAESSVPTRILLVDDDVQMLRLIGHHLRREGFEVLTAETSAQGLGVAMEHNPQILITDWMMPEMSGIELCATLRRCRAGAKMYVIMVTARGEDEQIVEAFDSGADDYVVKPFNPRILLARVRAAQRMILLRERVEDSDRAKLQQVAELGIMTRKLRAAALTDALTELPNRRYAMKRLKQEWEAARRSGRPLSVVMCDIDHFKRVNDDHGHDVGDLVLREVAHTLQSNGRASDVLCRLGGEEFLVINVASDTETVVTAAERLRAAVEHHVIAHPGFDRGVTLSLGVAHFAPSMQNVDDLIKAADEALYMAKEAGRNRVCVSGEEADGSEPPQLRSA